MTFESGETGGLVARRLRYAFVASLLVHVLIFWPVGVRVLKEDTPSLLQTTLRPLQQPVAEAPAAKPPLTVPPAPTFAPPSPTLSTKTLDQPRQDSVPPAPMATPENDAAPPSVTLSVPAVTRPAAPPAPAGEVVATLLSEANASSEAIDGLRGYRLALATQARRFKRYPAQAMASGWAGRADIRVEVGSDGRPRAATVTRSSGHELLDRAALAMIDAGALRARLPESLRGKAFVVELPVVFDLADE